MLVSAQRPFPIGFVTLFFPIILATCWSCENSLTDGASSQETQSQVSDDTVTDSADSLFALSDEKFVLQQPDSGLFYLEKGVTVQETKNPNDPLLFKQYVKIGRWYFDAFKFETAN